VLLVAAADALAVGTAPRAVARMPAVRAPSPQMGLMDFLSTLLYDRQIQSSRSRGGSSGSAGSAAMSRLKVVLAHDRTGLDELTMNKIREEILQVVRKYVIVADTEVRFDLQSDDQLTLVTATFPLTGPRAGLTGTAAPQPDDAGV